MLPITFRTHKAFSFTVFFNMVLIMSHTKVMSKLMYQSLGLSQCYRIKFKSSLCFLLPQPLQQCWAFSFELKLQYIYKQHLQIPNHLYIFDFHLDHHTRRRKARHLLQSTNHIPNRYLPYYDYPQSMYDLSGM